MPSPFSSVCAYLSSQGLVSATYNETSGIDTESETEGEGEGDRDGRPTSSLLTYAHGGEGERDVEREGSEDTVSISDSEQDETHFATDGDSSLCPILDAAICAAASASPLSLPLASVGDALLTPLLDIAARQLVSSHFSLLLSGYGRGEGEREREAVVVRRVCLVWAVSEVMARRSTHACTEGGGEREAECRYAMSLIDPIFAERERETGGESGTSVAVQQALRVLKNTGNNISLSKVFKLSVSHPSVSGLGAHPTSHTHSRRGALFRSLCATLGDIDTLAEDVATIYLDQEGDMDGEGEGEMQRLAPFTECVSTYSLCPPPSVTCNESIADRVMQGVIQHKSVAEALLEVGMESEKESDTVLSLVSTFTGDAFAALALTETLSQSFARETGKEEVLSWLGGLVRFCMNVSDASDALDASNVFKPDTLPELDSLVTSYVRIYRLVETLGIEEGQALLAPLAAVISGVSALMGACHTADSSFESVVGRLGASVPSAVEGALSALFDPSLGSPDGLVSPGSEGEREGEVACMAEEQIPIRLGVCKYVLMDLLRLFPCSLSPEACYASALERVVQLPVETLTRRPDALTLGTQKSEEFSPPSPKRAAVLSSDVEDVETLRRPDAETGDVCMEGSSTPPTEAETEGERETEREAEDFELCSDFEGEGWGDECLSDMLEEICEEDRETCHYMGTNPSLGSVALIHKECEWLTSLIDTDPMDVMWPVVQKACLAPLNLGMSPRDRVGLLQWFHSEVEGGRERERVQCVLARLEGVCRLTVEAQVQSASSSPLLAMASDPDRMLEDTVSYVAERLAAQIQLQDDETLRRSNDLETIKPEDLTTCLLIEPSGDARSALWGVEVEALPFKAVEVENNVHEEHEGIVFEDHSLTHFACAGDATKALLRQIVKGMTVHTVQLAQRLSTAPSISAGPFEHVSAGVYSLVSHTLSLIEGEGERDVLYAVFEGLSDMAQTLYSEVYATQPSVGLSALFAVFAGIARATTSVSVQETLRRHTSEVSEVPPLLSHCIRAQSSTQCTGPTPWAEESVVVRATHLLALSATLGPSCATPSTSPSNVDVYIPAIIAQATETLKDKDPATLTQRQTLSESAVHALTLMFHPSVCKSHPLAPAQGAPLAAMLKCIGSRVTDTEGSVLAEVDTERDCLTGLVTAVETVGGNLRVCRDLYNRAIPIRMAALSASLDAAGPRATHTPKTKPNRHARGGARSPVPPKGERDASGERQRERAEAGADLCFQLGPLMTARGAKVQPTVPVQACPSLALGLRALFWTASPIIREILFEWLRQQTLTSLSPPSLTSGTHSLVIHRSHQEREAQGERGHDVEIPAPVLAMVLSICRTDEFSDTFVSSWVSRLVDACNALPPFKCQVNTAVGADVGALPFTPCATLLVRPVSTDESGIDWAVLQHSIDRVSGIPRTAGKRGWRGWMQKGASAVGNGMKTMLQDE
ncbi:hypothetical protein KIPB_003115 [Kipferlia bialata]|uniref:Uncharacterized protein n=1 Tax=Kipferlia bialata TaxID=797122 RepID=A0A9K3CT98_9EUKA|nr:hypothetical protein KIPB_003115 [Kipferlia bialata]|eukprot:g3115.t1